MNNVAIVGTGIQGLYAFWYLEKFFKIKADLYDISPIAFGGRIRPIISSYGEINRGCHYFSLGELTYRFLSDILKPEQISKFQAQGMSIHELNNKRIFSSDHGLPLIDYKIYKNRISNIDFDSLDSLYSLNKIRYGQEAANQLSKIAFNFSGVDTKLLDPCSRNPLQLTRICLNSPPHEVLKMKKKSTYIDEDIAVPKSLRLSSNEHDSCQIRGGLSQLFNSEYITNIREKTKKFSLTRKNIESFLSYKIGSSKYDSIVYTGSTQPIVEYFNHIRLTNSSSSLALVNFMYQKECTKRTFLHDFTSSNVTRLSLEPYGNNTLIIIEQHNKKEPPQYDHIFKYLEIDKYNVECINKSSFSSFLYLPTEFSRLYKNSIKLINKKSPNVILPDSIYYSTHDLIYNLTKSLDKFFSTY